MDCIFCKIVAGQIPSPRLYEDENTIVIRDVSPQSKHHFLVLPKKHVASLAELFVDEAEGRGVMGNLFSAANAVATQESSSMSHQLRPNRRRISSSA